MATNNTNERPAQRGLASDATIGAAIAQANFWNLWESGSRVVIMAVVLFVLLGTGLMRLWVGGDVFALAATQAKAHIWTVFQIDGIQATPLMGRRPPHVFTAHVPSRVQPLSGTADQWINWSHAIAATQDVKAALPIVGSLAGIIAAALAAMAELGLWRLGERRRDARHLRGSRVVALPVLARDLRRRGRAGPLLIAPGLPLPVGAEVQHILAAGVPGAGKSTLIGHLLAQIRARGDMAIVYDPKADFLARFYRSGSDANPNHTAQNRSSRDVNISVGDVILNPLDARAPKWHPLAEVDDPADAARIAAGLIALPRGGDDTFARAARMILADTLLALRDRPMRDLWRCITLAGPDEMRALLGARPGARQFADGNERFRESVMNSLVAGAQGLQFLDADAAAGNSFSVREYVRAHADRAGAKPWLFLGARPEHHDATAGIVAAMIEAACAGLFSLGTNPVRRVWFVLDEFPTLPRMPMLARLLAEGRGYGACAVLGFQSTKQVEAVWGSTDGLALLSLPSTIAALRTTEPAAGRWLSDSLGEAVMERANESSSIGARRNWRGPAETSVSVQRERAPILLPSQLAGLKDLHGYVRLAGETTICEAEWPYVARPVVSPAFVPRDAVGRVVPPHPAPVAAAEPEPPQANDAGAGWGID